MYVNKLEKIATDVRSFFTNILFLALRYKDLKKAISDKNNMKSRINTVSDIQHAIYWFKWRKDKPWDWQPWVITICLNKLKDDCISAEEEIYTEHGIKKVADLNIGDKVLSYDFKNQKQCYSEIDKIWEKGELDCEKVYFGRGENIRSVVVTPNTPFLHRINQKGNSIYQKETLNNIDLTKWWKRKVPAATKIQYNIKDIDWITPDLCFIIGHFLAEGWTTNYCGQTRVFTSGFEIDEYIIPKLKINNIPFLINKNKNGIPQLNFLKSKFSDFLKTNFNFKSLKKHIPEILMRLPEEKLKNILDGYFLGDGHYHKESKYYSTISNRLSEDIVRIHLQLGLPIGGYLQFEHQGLGDNPIWRIHSCNTNKSFINRGYNDLGEISILRKENIGKVNTRDFRVKDTHVFFLKNGVMCHNCDGAAILGKWLMSLIDIDSNLLIIEDDNKKDRHMVCVSKDRKYMVSNDSFIKLKESDDWETEVLNWNWHRGRYTRLLFWE